MSRAGMLPSGPLRVGIAGATGAVGQELLNLLEEDRIPVGELRLLASARSAGRELPFRDDRLVVQELTDAALQGLDLVFFSCGGDRSRRFVPAAVRAGAVVVDNSSAFRLDPSVPLVVPEVNPEAALAHSGVIAVPNCTTIVYLMAVAPLHRVAGLRHSVVSSYQAASGAGAAGLRELEAQRRALAEGREPAVEAFAVQLADNVIPHIDTFREDGWTREERKLVDESRKILSHPELEVAATCVRVPVGRAHSVSAQLAFERALTPEEAREVLRDAPGVVVVDEPGRPDYPTPLTASGRREVFVGRVRHDGSARGGLLLWAVGDQLLKGAAWNALQIAELLIPRGPA